jgi:hypothetical protein
MSLNIGRHENHINSTFVFDLKQLAAFVLALFILLQPFSKMSIYIFFKINQDQIAKTLCVKKNIKNNTCKGKCHLKKQLQETEKGDQTPEDQKEKFEVQFFCHQKLPSVHSFNYSHKIPFSEYHNHHYAFIFLGSTFHPPRFV